MRRQGLRFYSGYVNKTKIYSKYGIHQQILIFSCWYIGFCYIIFVLAYMFEMIYIK